MLPLKTVALCHLPPEYFMVHCQDCCFFQKNIWAILEKFSVAIRCWTCSIYISSVVHNFSGILIHYGIFGLTEKCSRALWHKRRLVSWKQKGLNITEAEFSIIRMYSCGCISFLHWAISSSSSSFLWFHIVTIKNLKWGKILLLSLMLINKSL